MASGTPTRRVLSDLSVNKGLRGLGAGAGAEREKMGKIQIPAAVSLHVFAEGNGVGIVDEGRGKRSYDLDSRESQNEISPKRVKTQISVERRDLGLGEDMHGVEGKGISSYPEVPIQETGSKHFTSPSSSSPLSAATSPFTSSPSPSPIEALNDTQQTMLTEPDEAPLPIHGTPTSLPLTQGQLRVKAKEMRLRLRLALYKVKTDQTNVPLERLEARTVKGFSATISSTTTSSRTPIVYSAQNETPLPARGNIPEIQLEGPSAEKAGFRDGDSSVDIASSPPPPPAYQLHSHQMESETDAEIEDTDMASPSKLDMDREVQGFATPLLQRQRHGLLNPPDLGGSGYGSELTSSGVKGRAADGLLKLMRQA